MPKSRLDAGRLGKAAASSSPKKRLQSVASVVGIALFLLAILVFQTAVGWFVFLNILIAIAMLAIVFMGHKKDKDEKRKRNWTRDFIALAIFALCLAAAIINLS